MQMVQMAVQIRAENGRTGGVGEVDVAQPPLRRRIMKAGVLFLAGAAIGVLLLPVPLIHLFGIFFFLGMGVLGFRRLFATSVLKGARGRCPSCQAEGSYFVGMGGRRLSFPIVTSCPHCHASLELEPAPPVAV